MSRGEGEQRRGGAGAPRAPGALTLGAGLLLAGIGFDATAALVPGVALTALATLALVWVELASRWARLEREPGPRRVVEGEPYPLRIRLRGALLPPPGGELFEVLLGGPIQLPPLWRGRLGRELELSGPGRRKLGTACLVVRDPLGLWQRSVRAREAGELVVLPRIEPVRVGGGDGNALGEGSGSEAPAQHDSVGGAELELDGLRPYREGSPASRIHWPAVARTGEMVERHLTSGGADRPLVVLDVRSGGDDADRERAIRAAASLCVRLATDGGCELLLPGERRPIAIDSSLRAWPEAHVRLAVARHGAPGGTSSALRSGAVFWVSTAASPPRLLARLGGGGYLVSPGRARGAAAFTVAGCHGRALAASRGRAPARTKAGAG